MNLLFFRFLKLLKLVNFSDFISHFRKFQFAESFQFRKMQKKNCICLIFNLSVCENLSITDSFQNKNLLVIFKIYGFFKFLTNFQNLVYSRFFKLRKFDSFEILSSFFLNFLIAESFQFKETRKIIIF